MTRPRLILASRSPRRATLLREAGFAFTQTDPPFADPPQPDTTSRHRPADLAIELAAKKAHSLLESLNLKDGSPVVILGADTLCVTPDGQLIGQPANRQQASQMIQQFANHRHDVVTGVALLASNGSEPITFADTAAVSFGDLHPDQLETYLDTNQWQGKAGGYNLFDRQAHGWPIQVHRDHDPTTVVGLPMRKLLVALDRLDIRPANALNA